MLQCSFGMAPSTLNVGCTHTDALCPCDSGTVESRWTGEGHEYACTHQQRQMYVYLGWQYLCYQSQWKYDDSGKVIKGEKVRK